MRWVSVAFMDEEWNDRMHGPDCDCVHPDGR
jgi:hypothetical protein